jgi:hypothetical protein
VLGAATTAAVALLLKFEFGFACYGSLLVVIVAQSFRQRSWKPIWTGALAVLPGVLACAAVVRWMVSIRGADFITQENILSWPTSYFMRVYGKMWLAHTGLILTRDAFLTSAGRILTYAGIAAAVYLLLRRRRSQAGGLFLTVALGVALFELLSIRLFPEQSALFRLAFFPKDMVFIVVLATAASAWFCFRKGFAAKTLLTTALFTFPALLAFRMLMGMELWGYPVYYNATVILAFLLLGSRLMMPTVCRSRSSDFRAELAVCGCCLIWVATHAGVFFGRQAYLVPLRTARGVVYAQKHLVANYQSALAFMKERAAAAESVLSVPEDTSLYFLSGTQCPIRVSQFTPGVLVPGKMTEDVIQEIEDKKVAYLLWSNRTFVEYGVPVFGRFYDTVFADYLTSHYCPVGPVYENKERGWNAVIWKRMGDENGSR